MSELTLSQLCGDVFEFSYRRVFDSHMRSFAEETNANGITILQANLYASRRFVGATLGVTDIVFSKEGADVLCSLLAVSGVISDFYKSLERRDEQHGYSDEYTDDRSKLNKCIAFLKPIEVTLYCYCAKLPDGAMVQAIARDNYGGIPRDMPCLLAPVTFLPTCLN